MTDATLRSLLRDLNNRRQALKMTTEALAQRSGLSRVTVCRLLSGSHPRVSLLHVVALAEALGVQIEFKPMMAVDEFARRQAKHHARRLVRMMQGTMGLEAQAVSPDFLARMEEETSERLLNGSWKKLWVE